MTTQTSTSQHVQPTLAAAAANTSVPSNMANAAQLIGEELAREPSNVMTLSPHALTALEIAHANFLGDVGQESIRIARRANLRTVDDSHVKESVARIGKRVKKSVGETAFNSIGGVIAGAGIASIYAVNFSPGPHSTMEHMTGFGLAIIGGICLTIGLMMSAFKNRD